MNNKDIKRNVTNIIIILNGLCTVPNNTAPSIIIFYV